MEENLDGVTVFLHKAELFAERDRVAKTEARLRGEAFNVYRTCGVDHYENSHSRILAEWLNPKGAHGQGDLFLSLFLQFTLDDFSKEFDSSSASVYTEYSTNEGRLDVLIEDNDGRAVIIENKIYAADQAAQLKRYEKYARKKYSIKGYRLLYLTLEGCEASEQSGKDVEYFPLSYKGTILSWLEACVKAVYDKPLLRESLIQYRNLIKQLTGQDMDRTVEKELVAEMMRTPQAVAAILQAYPAWEKEVLETKLFKPLEEFALRRGFKFTVDSRFWAKNTWGFFSFQVKENLSIVFQYEGRGRTNFYYGIVDKRPDRRDIKPLPGLEDGNENWRYGWHYFDMHLNWTTNDIVEMSNDGGAFVNYICSAVDNMMTQMKSNSIL